MALTFMELNILEECQIRPPSSTPLPNTSLPLTFLDLPWLLLPPSQPLFFYNCKVTSDRFTSIILPKLKHSLSMALLHFYPFAGKLSSNLELVYAAGGSACLTVAEAAGFRREDVEHLCSNTQHKEAHLFQQLVPSCLELSVENDVVLVDLLAVKITFFPLAGCLSIGLAYPEAVCDQRTFNNFFKTWASFCKTDGPLNGPEPNYDRSLIVDSNGLESTLLAQWLERGGASSMRVTAGMGMRAPSGLVRATFVMGPTEINNARNWIAAQSSKKNKLRPNLSPYMAVCAFVWVCLAQTQEPSAHEGPMYFGFVAGGMSRLDFQVPATYFGNYVAFGRVAVAGREELVGEDGIERAAAAIEQTIKRLNGDILGRAEDWIGDCEEIIGSDIHVNVTGSPKVNLYETDFGWGRPKKVEQVAIDVMRGISLCESGEMKGGMEIGVTLPKWKMDHFSTLFYKGLDEFSLPA